MHPLALEYCQEVSRERISELEKTHTDIEDFFSTACDFLIHLYDEYPVCTEGFFGNLPLAKPGECSPGVKKNILRNGKAINAIFLGAIQKNIDNGTFRNDMTAQELYFILWSCFYGLFGMARTSSEYIVHFFPNQRDVLPRRGLSNILRIALNNNRRTSNRRVSHAFPRNRHHTH